MKTHVQLSFRSGLIVWIVFISCLGIDTCLAGGLTGKYTIDKSKAASSSNYISFNDADSDLLYGKRASGGATNGPGVNAGVTFDVANGTYSEKIRIGPIKGASSSNTITFESASKDSSKVIIRNKISGSKYSPGFVVDLDSASFVIFNRITFRNYTSLSGSSDYDFVILMDDKANNNTFTNCSFIGPLNLKSSVTSTSATIFSGFYAYTYSMNNNNTFRNNYISGNAYGIYWMGYNTTSEKGNVFDHNIIDSVSNYGVYLYNEDSFTLTGNKIFLRKGGYGVSFLNYGIISTHAGLFANNFISVGTNAGSLNYGMYFYYVDTASVVYNNVNIYGAASAGSAAFYDYNSTTSLINLENNNLINKNTGSSDYAINVMSVANEDFNNLKTGGGNLVSYYATAYSTLSDWKTSGYGFAVHDISVNPGYSSNFDLHVSNTFLNGKATPLPYDTIDIDGQKRDTLTPDIGADEFTLPALNASVIDITNPTSGFCPGLRDIYVTLSNGGLATLTSANILWYVNDTLQGSFHWTGSIASASNASVKVGSYNFSLVGINYKIRAYADSANNSSMSISSSNNDSVYVNAGLNSGSYTINKSGSGSTNFKSFREAADALHQKGLCGAITINVSSGTYNESVEMRSIPNASSVNTVTFQSAALDSTKVTLDTVWAGTATSPGYTLKFNGASYITFRSMTFKNIITTSTYYGDVIIVSGGSNYINILNNIIASNRNSVFNYGSCIYNDVYSSDNYITIAQNHISGAYYGVNSEGSNSTPERGNAILNNTIDESMDYGIYIQYEDSCIISGNKIFEDNLYCVAGVYVYCISGSTAGYVYKDTLLLANNFVTMSKNCNGEGMLIYASLANIYFNSVDVDNAIHYPIKFPLVTAYKGVVGTYYVNLYNNIFSNSGGGIAINITPPTVTHSDYNDLYSSGSYLGLWYGTTYYKTISDWVLNTGFDSNSVSGDPHFNSASKGNLHLTSSSHIVEHRGMYFSSVITDIDGDKRTFIPCIGADETPLEKIDAGIASIDSPALGFCGGTRDVWAKLRNYGSDTLKSVNIYWSIDGITIGKTAWSGSLSSGARVLVNLGSHVFTSGKTEKFEAWTDSPNVSMDGNSNNDLAQRIIGSALSGTFTIGGASPDFSDFRTAVNVLKKTGVCGNVTFNVRDGSYKESVVVPRIFGSSASNKITFQSQSLDSTKVTIDTGMVGGSNITQGYVLSLSGCNFVTFREMTIKNTNTAAGYSDGVLLTNGAGNCTIENNIISTFTTNNEGYTVNDDLNYTDTNLVIRNNVISGGYYGISFYRGDTIGSIYVAETGNIAENNIISGCTYAGIVAYSQDAFRILKNKINLKNASYGILIEFNFQNTDSSLVANNFVSMQGGGVAIRVTDPLSINYYYNTFINNSSTDFTAEIFYPLPSCVQNFENNIVANLGSGRAIEADSGIFNISNFNDLYSAGSTLATWVTAATLVSCKTLSDYYYASGGYDYNSVNSDPKVSSFSTGDLHLTSSSGGVIKKGNPVSYIADDIDGDYRTSPPDIGADQYSLDNNDIGVSAIFSPNSKTCGSASTLVTVRVSNYGLNDQTSFKVYVDVNKGSYTGNKSFSGTLRGLGSASPHDTTIDIPVPSWNSTSGGVAIIKAYTVLSGDGISADDTTTAIVTLQALPDASFSIDTSAGKSLIAFKPTDTTLSSYHWNFGDGGSDSIIAPSHSYTANGLYKVTLLVTNKNGCTDSFSDNVRVLFTGISFASDNSFLAEVYPNPFTDHTNISYTLDNTDQVQISVFDITGRIIATLVNTNETAGSHSVIFNPSNYSSNPAGIYIVSMKIGDRVSEYRLVNLK